MCWYIKFRKDLYHKDAYNPKRLYLIFLMLFFTEATPSLPWIPHLYNNPRRVIAKIQVDDTGKTNLNVVCYTIIFQQTISIISIIITSPSLHSLLRLVPCTEMHRCSRLHRKDSGANTGLSKEETNVGQETLLQAPT